MHLAGEGFGRFLGGDADCFTGANVHKRRCHLAPVATFQRALSQATAGHDGYRIRSAAVDFDKSDKPLAVPSVRIVDAKVFQAEHGQADSEYLARTKVAVSQFGIPKIFVEGFHELEPARGSQR